jgi:glycopeptide antibiotics resistance protein
MIKYSLKQKAQNQVNEYKDLFKKLIIYNFLTFIIITIYFFFFQSKQVENLNEYLFKNYSTFEAVLTIILLLIHLLSFYFLFIFKKIGISLFTFSLIGILILSLFQPIVFDGIEYVLDIISNILSGGILVLIYFTNLKNEFGNERIKIQEKNKN